MSGICSNFQKHRHLWNAGGRAQGTLCEGYGSFGENRMMENVSVPSSFGHSLHKRVKPQVQHFLRGFLVSRPIWYRTSLHASLEADNPLSPAVPAGWRAPCACIPQGCGQGQHRTAPTAPRMHWAKINFPTTPIAGLILPPRPTQRAHSFFHAAIIFLKKTSEHDSCTITFELWAFLILCGHSRHQFLSPRN